MQSAVWCAHNIDSKTSQEKGRSSPANPWLPKIAAAATQNIWNNHQIQTKNCKHSNRTGESNICSFIQSLQIKHNSNKQMKNYRARWSPAIKTRMKRKSLYKFKKILWLTRRNQPILPPAAIWPSSISSAFFSSCHKLVKERWRAQRHFLTGSSFFFNQPVNQPTLKGREVQPWQLCGLQFPEFPSQHGYWMLLLQYRGQLNFVWSGLTRSAFIHVLT